MRKLLGATLVTLLMLGLAAADADARHKKSGKTTQAIDCKYTAIKIVDETMVITGSGLTEGTDPEVRLGGGDPLTVESAAPEEVVVNVQSILGTLDGPTDLLLEIKRSPKDSACPSHLVTVIPTPTGVSNKIVFATSSGYLGDLTGGAADGECAGVANPFDRADCICNYHAQNATVPLAGNFIAWLSSTNYSASVISNAIERLANANAEGPWYNLKPGGGELVSATRADLVDCTGGDCIQAPIDYDENGTSLGGRYVWTGTYEDGTAITNDCEIWTQTFLTYGGASGNTSFTNASWTNFTSQQCNTAHPIICFEQP